VNYLGIDIGTSGCKAVVFDQKGQQLAQASREYDVLFSEDGGAELDSEIVLKNCFEIICDCSKMVEAKSIVGLGICSQGEAFTVIGNNNEPLCRAMISSDIRSKVYAEEWTQKIGEEKLYRITGHTAHPMFTLYKLLWLKQTKPEIWQKSVKFFCFEDLLHSRLGLNPAISWSLAGRCHKT
jgi:xylulokinase